MAESINLTLKEHETVVEDWKHREQAQWLHEWSERLNAEFKLNIETPAIRIDQIDVRALGSYRYGRNGFGLRHQITFNAEYLERPLADHLDTLLHELLHEWQDLHGEPSVGQYHNAEYRKKALSYGLIIDEWGHSLGVKVGPFTELLERYGIDITALPPSSEERPTENSPVRNRKPGKSKMKKWSCGCTNVRAAVRLNAMCLKCGNLFEKVDLG